MAVSVSGETGFWPQRQTAKVAARFQVNRLRGPGTAPEPRQLGAFHEKPGKLTGNFAESGLKREAGMSDPEPFKGIADRLEAIARDCFDIGAKARLEQRFDDDADRCGSQKFHPAGFAQ